MTVTGRSIKTDAYGRFHVPCAMIPDANRGSNFLLKLDERTLPLGSKVISENPRVIRLTRGKMSKANFAVGMPREVRIELDDNAWEGQTIRLKAMYAQAILGIERTTNGTPVDIDIRYKTNLPDIMIKRRLKALKKDLLALNFVRQVEIKIVKIIGQ